MGEMILATFGSVTLRADAAGLHLLGLDADALLDGERWPSTALEAPGGEAMALDLAVLLESGAARAQHGAILVPTEDVVSAMLVGIGLPTRFTEPSPFLLMVDRDGDLGRPTFAYRYTWLFGARPVSLERAGAYVRHAASHRVYHLDPKTVALVEAMDAFNATAPTERTPTATWGTFARVREAAEAVGAELDAQLASNTVVLPTQLAADVCDHGDGSISFVPRVPEIPDDSLADAFLRSRAALPTYSITRPGGERVRVVMEPRHRAVLDRMVQVRRVRGEERARVLADPAAVFDGVLADVELSFGDRVIGIGAFQYAPEPHDPRAGGFIESIVGERDASEVALPPGGEPKTAGHATIDSSDAPQDLIGGGGLPASIVLPRADGSGDATVRFRTPEEVADFTDAATAAHARGDEIVPWRGDAIRVEPAALEALGGIGVSGRAPARGRDGRLYLIIHDNDESLRDADVHRATEARATPAVPIAFRQPRALRADVTLKPHQRDGVRWLDTCRAVPGRSGVLLADDMGLGKTLQVLVHLANVIEEGHLADRQGQGDGPPYRPVLVVAPLILVENDTWTTEMASRFVDGGAVFQPVLKLYGSGIHAVLADEGNHDPLGAARLDPAKLMRYRVVITTYETLVNYQHSLARHVGGRPLWSVVVSDEAQKAKSMRTKTSVALKAVSPDFHVAATGTPVENRLLDLWNLIDAVQPGLLGTAQEFSRRYERPLAEGPDVQRGTLEALRSELLFGAPHAFVVRRSKAELTDLPPKHERVVQCPMTPDEAELHAGIVSALSRPGVGRRVLGLLQELAALAQHPWLGDEDRLAAHPDRLVAASAKLRATLDILDEIAARGEKVILFARLVAAQQLLARVLAFRYGVPVDIVNGETKRGGGNDVRKRRLDRFRRTPGFGAIVLSPFVAGVGLTITEANHVIHYGRWWNPAVEDQATDRAYRIGQSRPVTVYYPVLTDPSGRLPHGTFDEALHALVVRKRDVARDFLHPAPADDAEDAAELREALVGGGAARAPGAGAVATPIDRIAARRYPHLVVAVSRARGANAILTAPASTAGVHAVVVEGGRRTAWLVRSRDDGRDAACEDALAARDSLAARLGGVWRAIVVRPADGASEPQVADAPVAFVTPDDLLASANAAGVRSGDVDALQEPYASLAELAAWIHHR